MFAQAGPGTFSEAVSVDVETQVVKTLETAREHIVESQWEPAVAILQELIGSSGDTLVPVEPGRYSNTGDYCHLLISQFPAAGLAVYRSRVDAQAKEWFETGRLTRDDSMLRRVVDLAFNSAFGDDALWLLGELAFERGQYALARQYWSLLVPSRAPKPAVVAELGQPPSKQPGYLTHPDPFVSTDEVLARLVLCSIFEGDRSRAVSELAVCRTQFPDSTGMIAGEAGKLVDVLSDVLVESDQWQRAEPSMDVSVAPGGQANRSGHPEQNPATDQLIWRRSLPRNRFAGPSSRAAMESENPPPYFPLVSGGAVFLCGPDSVFAFELATGGAKWPIGDDVTGRIYTNILERPVMPHLPSAGLAWYTLCVSDGRLYARMGPPVMRRSRNEGNTFSEIVGLDIAQRESELVFHVTSDVLDPEAESPEATSWSFEGSPLVSDGRVYVSARRGFPEDETLVACFDADSSRLLWRRRVCASLKNASDRFNLIGQNLLTLGDDRLFLTTGTGAVAALDAEDGRLIWVVTYQSDGDETAHEVSDPRRHGLVPCVFHQGIVYVTPDDSNLILALDATTGQPVWRQRFPDRVLHIAGVVNRRLILCGQSVWAVDAVTGQPAWPEKIGFADPAGRGYGRPALSRDFLYWPMRDEILRIDHRSGRIAGRIRMREDFGQSGGNLVIADGRLLIAQPDVLVVLGSNSKIVTPKNEPANDLRLPSAPLPGAANRDSENRFFAQVSLTNSTTLDTDFEGSASQRARPVSAGQPEPFQSAGNVAGTIPENLWPARRAWQVDLPGDSTVWFPEAAPTSKAVGPIVTNTGMLQVLDPDDGRERWSVSISEPFDHVTVSGETLAFASPTVIVARSLRDGRLLWRRHFPASDTGRAEFRNGLDNDQILVVRDSAIVAFDSTSGKEAWSWPTDTRSEPVSKPAVLRFPSAWTFSRKQVLYRPAGSATHALIDLHNGQVLRRGTLPFVASALIELPTDGAPSRTVIVGASADHQIRATQLAEPGIQWQHKVSGIVHGSPEILSDGSTMVVVEDRQFAVRLDVESGQSLWRRPLSAIPLANVSGMTELSSLGLFSVSGGVARAFLVEDGTQKWHRYLGPGQWDIHIVSDSLICIDVSTQADDGEATLSSSSVVILDSANGNTRQRLRFPATIASADVGVQSDRCFVRAGNKLIGFRAWPSF